MDAKPPLYKTAPMQHQLEGLRRAKGREAFMFSCEQGTGKTWIAINEVAQLWGEGKLNGVLVFADNGVHSNWVEVELPKHMPDWVRWMSRAWNADALVKEARHIEEILGDTDSSILRIFCVNWEALAAPRSLAFIKRFCNSVTKLAILADESQAIMNPSTVRTKNLEKIKPASVMRRCMTGTPVGGKPFDVFAQYRFLDPSILRTTSFVAFKAEYADMLPPHHPMMMHIANNLPKGRPLPQIVARDEDTDLPVYKNLGRLSRLIEPYTYRVLKKECMDLPEKVYTQSFFDLHPAQRDAYKRMEKEYRYLAEDGTASAVSKLTAFGKLTQITSGFMMTPEGMKMLVRDEDNPKLQLLKGRLQQSINELGGQVIVWCHYIEEIAQVMRLLAAEKWTAASYQGSTSKAERTEAIRAFQGHELQVFVGQLQTASTGITLHAAAKAFYYSNTFSYIDRSQSEDRMHRIGLDHTALYEDLIGKDSRDLFVVSTLRAKKDVADIINRDPRGGLIAWEETDIAF